MPPEKLSMRIFFNFQKEIWIILKALIKNMDLWFGFIVMMTISSYYRDKNLLDILYTFILFWFLNFIGFFRNIKRLVVEDDE